jgi:hypothetical protein
MTSIPSPQVHEITKSKISLSTIANDEDAKPFLYYIHRNKGNIKAFMPRPPLLVTNRI